MSDRSLTPEEERTLAAVLSLASYRTFDGNEPAGAHGLTGQLLGLRAQDESSHDESQDAGQSRVRGESRGRKINLVPGDTTPVDLPDGPIPGRYFAGPDQEIEIVVSLSGGKLASLECVSPSGSAVVDTWPRPGEITTW